MARIRNIQTKMKLICGKHVKYILYLTYINTRLFMNSLLNEPGLSKHYLVGK